jgi:hypothetical protein
VRWRSSAQSSPPSHTVAPPINPRMLCGGGSRLNPLLPKEDGGGMAQRRIFGRPSPSPLYGAGGSALAAAHGDEEEREAEPDGGVFSGSFPTA